MGDAVQQAVRGEHAVHGAKRICDAAEQLPDRLAEAQPDLRGNLGDPLRER